MSLFGALLPDEAARQTSKISTRTEPLLPRAFYNVTSARTRSRNSTPARLPSRRSCRAPTRSSAFWTRSRASKSRRAHDSLCGWPTDPEVTGPDLMRTAALVGLCPDGRGGRQRFSATLLGAGIPGETVQNVPVGRMNSDGSRAMYGGTLNRVRGPMLETIVQHLPSSPSATGTE